ncbi:MAG TPA: MBL fold metallo-hydrolase [Anaerolineales bacterium]|nr:MBL fold metallo-hydrolase [Anaerolineales bacterium]
MDIVWYGLSCFRLSERGLASVVTDPFDSSVGLTPPKLKADVVTVSHDAPGHNYLKAVKAERRVITGPGEFEIGGVFITGIPMQADKGRKNGAKANTLYVFEFDGLTVAHLGDLSFVPTQAQIEDLGPVNVALVPVGGGGALAPSQAAEVISLIEPSVVVPMHYKAGKETLKLGPVSRFLSEMGISNIEPLDSLKLTKSGLSEETQVVLLKLTHA